MVRPGSAATLLRPGSAAALARSGSAAALHEEAHVPIAATTATISSVCALRGKRGERGRANSQAASARRLSGSSSNTRQTTRRCRNLYDTSWRSSASTPAISSSGLSSGGSAARGKAARNVVISGMQHCGSAGSCQSQRLGATESIIGMGIDIVKRADRATVASSSNASRHSRGHEPDVGSSPSGGPARAGASTSHGQPTSAVYAAAGAAADAGTATPTPNSASSGKAAGFRASSSSHSSEDLWDLADRLGMLSGFLSGSLVWDGGALLRAVVQGRLPALPPAHSWPLSPPRTASSLEGPTSEMEYGVSPQPPGLALPGSVTSTRRRSPKLPRELSASLEVCGNAALSRRPARRKHPEFRDPFPVHQRAQELWNPAPLQIVPLSEWLSDVTAGLLQRTSQALPSSLPLNDEFGQILDLSPSDDVKLSIRGRSFNREQHGEQARCLEKHSWKHHMRQIASVGQLPMPADGCTCEDLLVWQIRLAKRKARRRYVNFGRPMSLPPQSPSMPDDSHMEYARNKVPEMDFPPESLSRASTMAPLSPTASSSRRGSFKAHGRVDQPSAFGAGPPKLHLVPPREGEAPINISGRSTASARGQHSQLLGVPTPATDHAQLNSARSTYGADQPQLSSRVERRSRIISTIISMDTGTEAVGSSAQEEIKKLAERNGVSIEEAGKIYAANQAEEIKKLAERNGVSIEEARKIYAANQEAQCMDDNSSSSSFGISPSSRPGTGNALTRSSVRSSSKRVSMAVGKEGTDGQDHDSGSAIELNHRRESVIWEEQDAAKARARKKRMTIMAELSREEFKILSTMSPDDSDDEEATSVSVLSEDAPLPSGKTKSQGKRAGYKKGDSLFRVKSCDCKVLEVGKADFSDLDVVQVDSEGRLIKSLLPPPLIQDYGSVGAWSRQSSKRKSKDSQEVEGSSSPVAVATEPHLCGGVFGCLTQEFRQCLDEAGFNAVEGTGSSKNAFKESIKRMAALKQEWFDGEKANTASTNKDEGDADFEASLLTGNWQRRADAVQEGLEKEEALYMAQLDTRKQRYSRRLQAWSSKVVRKMNDPTRWSRKAELCRFKLRGLSALGEYVDFMSQQHTSSVPGAAKPAAVATAA